MFVCVFFARFELDYLDKIFSEHNSVEAESLAPPIDHFVFRCNRIAARVPEPSYRTGIYQRIGDLFGDVFYFRQKQFPAPQFDLSLQRFRYGRVNLILAVGQPSYPCECAVNEIAPFDGFNTVVFDVGYGDLLPDESFLPCLYAARVDVQVFHRAGGSRRAPQRGAFLNGLGRFPEEQAGNAILHAAVFIHFVTNDNVKFIHGTSARHIEQVQLVYQFVSFLPFVYLLEPFGFCMTF